MSKETINRILSINSTKLGPVIETSDQVALVLGKKGKIKKSRDEDAKKDQEEIILVFAEEENKYFFCLIMLLVQSSFCSNLLFHLEYIMHIFHIMLHF